MTFSNAPHVVRLRKLDLVFKVRYCPQPAHHDGCVTLFCELHGQAVEAFHGHVGDVLAALLQHSHPLLHCEQRMLGAVDQHRHDEVVVDLCCAFDDIKVSLGDRIERPGINCCCHRSVSSLCAVITKRDVVLP